MTTENMAAGIEVMQVLDELAAKSVSQMQRDPSIPAGTVLEEHEIADGAIHREIKQNSMVRVGKVQVPERYRVWDKYGNPSDVPTGQLNYHLNKPRADSPGERAFHAHSGEITRETCTICPEAKQPIEALCNFCTGARAIRPTFMSEEQLLRHKQLMHSLEYAAENEALDRAERLAALAAQERIAASQEALAQAMLAQMQNTNARGRRQAAETTEE